MPFRSGLNIDEDVLCWLDPRHIINNDVINSQYKNNSHSIYRNIATVYGEVFETGDFRESLKHIAFYNYFLRPAEISGESIKNDDTDNQISFETLLSLNKILNPNKIVFASKKVKKAFDSIFYCEDYIKNKDIDLSKIESTPHPTSPWWNRKSEPCNNETGKNYLKQILTND